MSELTMPASVQTIWWVGLLLTLLVFVPLAVLLLHTTWQAARSIRRYAADALEAAGGIAANTPNVVALDGTIAVAQDMLDAAGGIVTKLDTAASVLAERAEG